eukprot:scaffold10290_cov18-Tisochrysis_lutea.AAC.1
MQGHEKSSPPPTLPLRPTKPLTLPEGPFGDTLASLLVGEPFLDMPARGLSSCGLAFFVLRPCATHEACCSPCRSKAQPLPEHKANRQKKRKLYRLWKHSPHQPRKKGYQQTSRTDWSRQALSYDTSNEYDLKEQRIPADKQDQMDQASTELANTMTTFSTSTCIHSSGSPMCTGPCALNMAAAIALSFADWSA